MGKSYRRYVHDHSDSSAAGRIPTWERVTEGMYMITVTAVLQAEYQHGKEIQKGMYMITVTAVLQAEYQHGKELQKGMYMITVTAVLQAEYQHGKELQKVCT